MGVSKRLKVVTLNSHLICTLCSGYYIGATAIKDCLHTFCRSCILKYIQKNSFCPICEVQIHKECDKLWSSLRPDKTLQDLVYKMVPGLYQDEMRRRRQFYSRLGKDAFVTGEESGFLPNGARFFSQDDSISLSLEYYSQEENEENQTLIEKLKKLNEKSKRYLQCPAAVTVRHLKKFLRMKYGIGLDCWVDVIYNDECLPESFSLMDVAYTFSWKRTSPMRFSYRIFTKASIKAMKSAKNFQNSGVRDEERKKSKSALEQQKQNEYLGNFNLNPTNSNACKTQNCNKSYNYNNSENCDKNGTFLNKNKHEENGNGDKDCSEAEDYFQSSEDSETSGLHIISEKEESAKENGEDSEDSVLAGLQNRKKPISVSHFEEEAVDSFTAKKLLKNKYKSEEKKRKLGESSTSRRKSASLLEEYESLNKKQSLRKRRKTIADELSLNLEKNKSSSFENDDEDISLGDLKSEALRKVFITKDKPESSNKRKDDEEPRKKKRKKSKHHEEKMKKRKLEMQETPSVLSVDKDALKLKVKLPTNKSIESNDQKVSSDSKINSENNGTKTQETETKNPPSDKERLSHLRAVRHKNVQNKEEPKDFINAPPSLTISKVDVSEQQPTKSTLVESKPSLEIMLVNPVDKSKVKVEIKVGSPIEDKEKENPKPHGTVDNFGVLDLSEKSTRTKDDKPNLCLTKEVKDSPEKFKKSTHVSIMRIAQNLVNRKLAPVLPVQHVKTFDSMVDSTSTASGMRNLKTLSDTAVNILMASQSKTSGECQKSITESSPLRQHQNFSSSTNSSKDCEKNSELKIPMYPISRPNMHPSVPRYQEPQKQRKPVEKALAPTVVMPQNQTVRQIPDPFMVLNRQNQNQGLLKPRSEAKCENGDDKNPKVELRAIPPLQCIKKTLLPKKLDLPDKGDFFGVKTVVPNIVNNNTKSVQHSESKFFGMKNGDEKKGMTNRMYTSIGCVRKVENLSKTIESVAAGLTARAVSNAIDAK